MLTLHVVASPYSNVLLNINYKMIYQALIQLILMKIFVLCA